MTGFSLSYISNKERRGKKFSEKLLKIRKENQKIVFYHNHNKAQTPLNHPVHKNQDTKFNEKYIETKLITPSIQPALQIKKPSEIQRLINQNKKTEEFEKSKLVLSADDFFQNKPDPNSKNNLKSIINTSNNFNKQFVFQQITTEHCFINNINSNDKDSTSIHSIDTDSHDGINDDSEGYINDDFDDIICNYGEYDDDCEQLNNDNNNNMIYEENENNTNENVIYHETNKKKKVKVQIRKAIGKNMRILC